MPALLAFAGLFAQASAADLTVPGTHATLTAAVDAATTGDSITITNSATYTDVLHIQRPITLKAAVGQTPRLVGVASTNYIIRLTTDSQGTKIGDLAGGRIMIGNDSYDNTRPDAVWATAMKDVWIQHTTGTITLENVSLHSDRRSYNTGNATVAGLKWRDSHAFVFIGGTTVTQSLGGVDIRNCSFQNGSNAIWFHGLFSNPGALSTIEDCTFDPINFCIFTAGQGDIHMRRNVLTNASGWSPIYYNTGTAGANLIDRCWVRSKGGAALFNSAARRDHVTTITRSAFENPTTATGTVFSIAATSYGGGKWNIDHCDFYTQGGASIFTFANPTSGFDGNRGIKVTNCNLINNTGPIVVLGASILREAYLIFQNNNIVTPAAVPIPPNPASPNNFAIYEVENGAFSQVPDYRDRAAGDYAYWTPRAMVRAGTDGEPIGSFWNFATMTEGVLPPNRVQNFTIFE